ncbi:MAG: hypothetical protein MI807_15565 [Verrucomicrobiales bacterium]|nr:hypothetical protein [Verrucomicrobiales bacterium]
MSNDLKHAFGDRNNSEFVISPEGKVIIARAWSDPDQLREDLEGLVGKAETLTGVSDLEKVSKTEAERESKVATGIVPRVERPSGAQPLTVTAHEVKGGHPHYLKLRAEAASDLSSGGEGSLHLAFRLDPIHKVHWNNLAAPLRFEIRAPGGIAVEPKTVEAEKVSRAEADADPREFLIKVNRGESNEPIDLTVKYFACDDDNRWCKAVTQTFTVAWAIDRDAGRVNNRSSGGGRGMKGKGKGGKGMKGRPGSGTPDPTRILSRFDSNEDGKISRAEATGQMAARFDQADSNGDGFVTKEELIANFARRRGK